ncbi:hypothetical protein [Pedobacter hiemivivus]|nr:hypothetical protein [Pedobacter hiemivivus]
MRKLIVLGILGIIGWMPFKAEAQVSISLNIGSQPLWGPVGYDYVDNYYLPEIECYYNVPRRQFIYMDNSRWIFSASLPSRYRGYDLYGGYKVVVNSRDPYRNFDRDRVTYARYRSVRGQQVIRYSNDSRYYVVKGHPHYGMSHGQAKKYYSRDNDRGHGNWDRGDRDHGRGRDRDDHDRGGRDHDRGGRDHGRGRH